MRRDIETGLRSGDQCSAVSHMGIWQYQELAMTEATGNNEEEQEKGECIKEDTRAEYVEEDKRIQYMGEDRRVQYMEEDKGSRKDLYKVM